MLNKARFLIIAVAVVVATGLAFAPSVFAQHKYGVVDLQLAIASTKEGKKAKEKLEKVTKKKQKELDEKVEKIKKMEEEMQKQMPLMSEGGKKDMLERYRKEMMELQQMYQDNQMALAKQKGHLLEPILQKMSGIVQDLALSEGYTVILDKADGTVLYHDPAIDLTAEVIKRYNKTK